MEYQEFIKNVDCFCKDLGKEMKDLANDPEVLTRCKLKSRNIPTYLDKLTDGKGEYVSVEDGQIIFASTNTKLKAVSKMPEEIETGPMELYKIEVHYAGLEEITLFPGGTASVEGKGYDKDDEKLLQAAKKLLKKYNFSF